ncbi:MAG: hypothetical protein H0V71_02155 [Chloroflexi bacterium]|nr:hypothetical protein [Chloroflexota bacterium]
MVARKRPAPSQPFSLRLPDDRRRALEEEAGRYRVAPRTLAQELIDEGLRMRRFPSLTFAVRGPRRAAVFARAPRLRVSQAMETVRDSSSSQEAAEDLALSVNELEQALDYYNAYKDEIDREIEEDRRYSKAAEREWLQRQPHPRS